MKRGLILACVAILAIGVTVSAQKEVRISKADVPSRVIKSFETVHKDAKATDYEKTVIEGKTCYVIDAVEKEVEKDYIYSEDGILIQTEEDIDVASLPKAVMNAIKKAHPKGEIDEVDKIVRGEVTQYQVIVEDGESDFEILVAADGKIITTAMVPDSDEDQDTDVGDVEDGD